MKISIFPNIGGHGFSWRQVGEKLEQLGASVCYHQAQGLIDGSMPRETIELCAKDYLSEAFSCWRSYPDVILGFCFGSLTAHCAATQLDLLGLHPLLVLVDPPDLPFCPNPAMSGHPEIDAILKANRLSATRYKVNAIKNATLVFLSCGKTLNPEWSQALKTAANIAFCDCDHLEVLNLHALEITRKIYVYLRQL